MPLRISNSGQIGLSRLKLRLKYPGNSRIYITQMKFTKRDILAACSLFLGALTTQLNTVLNNAYSFGSTLFDSGIEQSILWRSGWLLTPARVFESHSYFEPGG